jgi:hypothetical protein
MHSTKQPDSKPIKAFLLIETASGLRIIIGNSLAGVLISIASALGGAAFAKSAGLAMLMKHFGL